MAWLYKTHDQNFLPSNQVALNPESFYLSIILAFSPTSGWWVVAFESIHLSILLWVIMKTAGA